MQCNKIDSKNASAEVLSVDKSEVGNKARKGVKWAGLQIILRNFLSLGTTAILARLLSPSDFGLVGMVATLTALLSVFSDMGLSWATIQKKQLSTIQVSNLFWINTFVGGVLWGVCIVSASNVANFYNQVELINITIALGAGFLLSGLAAQPIALLNRSMNYKAVAQIEIFAMVVGAVAALISAFNDFGYWALVVQSLVNQFMRAILALLISQISLSKPQRNVGTKSLIQFGGLLAINGLLIYFARNFDSILIGKYWGIEDLGYYNRAYFLMLLPSMLATGILTKLMVPSLSALQGDKERFGNAYRRSLRMVAFFGCPMALGLLLTVDEMVLLVYGEEWQPVIPMLMWLGIASITQPLYNTTGWLFTAAGKAKSYLWLTVISGLVLVIAFFIALPSGALGIARAYGLVMGLIIFIPAMWLAHKVAGLNFRQSCSYVFPVFLCLVGMAITVIGIDYFVGTLDFSWQLKLATKIAVGVFSYSFLALIFMKSFIKKELFSMFNK
ncbi:lipopolysaccharide biosynthesis protein [Vibrio alginolyticus]